MAVAVESSSLSVLRKIAQFLRHENSIFLHFSKNFGNSPPASSSLLQQRASTKLRTMLRIDVTQIACFATFIE